MDKFIQNIKELYFSHVNVDIYADSKRLVIEIKKDAVFSYYPVKGLLEIKDPLIVSSGLEIMKLYNNQVGDTNEDEK